MKLLPLLFVMLVPMLFSCASRRAIVVPEDMSPNRIIQNAQQATDLNRDRVALQYYQTLLDRFGHINEFYVIGMYEIAFIHFRQGRFAEARQGFEHLLALYGAPGGETLPPRFRVLSEMILSNMTANGH